MTVTPSIRRLSLVAACALFLAAGQARAEPSHAIAMLGDPKYPAGFTHFDYVNPDAPKGGSLRLHALGAFDSLIPYIVRGKPAAGLHHGSGMYFETLAARARDEPFTLYGLLAETIETPADRTWVEFTLRPEARFSDGSPVTVDDVIFSWETLKEKSRPNARATWSRVAGVRQTGPRSVRFDFANTDDRELPLLIAGFMPVLSKAWWSGREFDATTLEPPLASGAYVIAEVDPGRSITFRRNPDYWGNGLPVNAGRHNFDEIRYDYFRDASVALEAFKAGDYDLRVEGDATRWATQYDFPAVADGRVERTVLETGTPSGLSALTFNLRKQKFRDMRVRDALIHAFDFEWLNRALLHGGYARTASMFTGSDMAPAGPPDGPELALLEPWRGQIPDAVFGPPYRPPVTDGSGRPRANLKHAAALLDEAGWRIVDGARRNEAGEPFQIEITIRRPSNEKIALAYARNLKRLGIEAAVRLVESAQFQGLIDTYDFDMVFGFWGVSLSPGNEQQNYWSSRTADLPGGRNWAGVADPAIDAMIAALGAAQTREELVAAARALDRILMWNRYVLPLYHDPGQRIARWTRVAQPDVIPVYGLQVQTMWEAAPR
ncbi:MAG: ABC transporter substrate-binding protein [Alphaproteobacteria bacterium]|nr:ABC transporter substrate-binding protein [Alphaproteobacteria bacterium]